MKKKRITLILAALTAISLLITLTACGNGNSASETASDVSSFEETASAESTLSSEMESEINSEIASEEPAENPEQGTEQPTEQQANTTTNNTNTGNNTTYTPPSNGGGNSGSNTNTGGNGGNTNAGTATKPQQQQQTVAPTQPQPTVHAPIYRQQWVVDQAAWSEEVPVWGNKGITVCNTCGADISGFAVEHIKQHTLAGEGGSYHSETKKVQTGTKTIYHDEVGHWESVLVCGGCTGTH